MPKSKKQRVESAKMNIRQLVRGGARLNPKATTSMTYQMALMEAGKPKERKMASAFMHARSGGKTKVR